jgi:1-deoxyxylulose-5-phosphate synthase
LNGTPSSRLVFGAMQFGGRADAAQSAGMFAACRASGITHFDTAHTYTDGASETLLGQMIRADRDTLLIATKVGYTGGADARNIRNQFDLSRSRLDLDVVDILYLHRFDPDTDLRETMEGFARLRDDRLIRYVGLSNFAAWQVMKAIAVAAEFDQTIDILQPMYNLVKRQAEVEILPMCADQNVAVATYSPLGGGLLTGKYAKGGEGRLREDDRYAARYGQRWMHDAAFALSELAKAEELDPATLAVAWVAAHSTHPMPIISGRTTEQLEPALAALNARMDTKLYDRLSALSPTPPPATDRIEEQA